MRRLLARCATAVAVVTAGALALSAGVSTTACTTHQCDPSFEIFGGAPGEGHLVDEDTWESSTVDGPWLKYDGQRTWLLCPKGLGLRIPSEVIPYVSVEDDPNGGVTNGRIPAFGWVIASGNLAEIAVWPTPSPEDPFCGGNYPIKITNNSCGDYLLRVVVKAPPRSQQDGDAGTDAPLVDDASSDATDDAPSDGG